MKRASVVMWIVAVALFVATAAIVTVLYKFEIRPTDAHLYWVVGLFFGSLGAVVMAAICQVSANMWKPCVQVDPEVDLAHDPPAPG